MRLDPMSVKALEGAVGVPCISEKRIPNASVSRVGIVAMSMCYNAR